MYIPTYFTGKDQERALAFIQRFNFGTIITAADERPIGTHLPFVASKKKETIVLTSHLSKGNLQWKQFESKQVLCIFTEPHAYISPRHYDKKEQVPTWNYVSIHAYGKAKIIHEKQQVFEVLESMMDLFEPEYKKQWRELSSVYKANMAKGIVAFEIVVNELQANEKLSQNKSENEQNKIITSLSKSDNENERTIAEYMSMKKRK